MPVDIVIPTFGQEQFTVNCLQSIGRHTDKNDYRIVWVDNGSTEDSRKIVMDEIQNHNYLSIWMSSNTGFVKATNAGIQAGKSEYVLLQNNDTQVTAGWLDRMMEALNSDSQVMSVGPLTDTAGSWQGWQNVTKHNSQCRDIVDLSKFTDTEVSEFLQNKFNKKYIPVQMVAFFCTLFKRKVFDEIGVLDEIFKIGFGDDDDYCHRMIKAGYKILFVPSAFVHHYHRTTFKDVFGLAKIKQMQTENLNIFKDKHKLK